MADNFLFELILGLEAFELVLGPYFALRFGDRRYTGAWLDRRKALQKTHAGLS